VKTVLITGADGIIGTILRRRLADRYDLRLLSRKPMDEPAHVADLADYAALRPAFDGVDAVVHLAAASDPDSEWDEVLSANIVGTRNMFEAAREAGVAQVVFASSNHAVGMYEVEGAPGIYRVDPDKPLVDERAEPRPDSLYGVSKGYGELLGRFYAERHGLRVICLRIGWVWEEDEAPRDNPRAEAIWLSHRDCAQLVSRALDADDVRFAIVYGISNNPRGFFSLRGAKEILGFEPQDAPPH
jgi:nucleoside-diphosphate-sugar epimerase